MKSTNGRYSRPPLVFLMIGGYAMSRLTGILSSDAVLALRENRAKERKLERLVDHVIVIGFGPLGRLVAGRLRDAGSPVVVVDRAEDLSAQACAGTSIGVLRK